ncbi:hypothetical protein [uncultured Lamprocystis sp.]|jgi:hypothetical protein|uniref:hypothetical protein n=1 Tax=uncultured Lamprocystis sp. TaxID=543132 RepID=UPI0025DA66D7|nr:hypothetical protein [uncultured Lamprocystis sp.]
MHHFILRRITLITLALLGVLPITQADGDDGGPVASDTVTIGGDQFSLDPRQGVLSYGYTFFKGNVNYGQTPFSLALQYQQSAAGTYVGNFTDSNSHAHPYGVSAYLPTALPRTNQPNSSNDNDLSKASYDFGFSDTSKPNFVIPHQSGDKTYGSGLNQWLDGLYYHENQDSSGCSSSDTVIPIELTYGTTITTTYPDADRNRTQTLVYDAYGRTQSESVTASGGWNTGQPITTPKPQASCRPWAAIPPCRWPLPRRPPPPAA